MTLQLNSKKNTTKHTVKKNTHMFPLTMSSGLVHLPTFFYVGSMFKVNTSNMSDCQCYQKTNHSPISVKGNYHLRSCLSQKPKKHPTHFSSLPHIEPVTVLSLDSDPSTISTASPIMSTTFIPIKWSPDLQPCWGSKSDHNNSPLTPYQQLPNWF